MPVGGRVFLDAAPKGTSDGRRRQINWTPSKVKLLRSKDTIKKLQDSPQDGKKIFASQISDKRLASRIYKELSMTQ